MSIAETQIYNLASSSLETRRIPDPYYYVFGPNGELLSEYGEPVPIETSTALGRAEYAGFQKLEKWFSQNIGGEMLWLSPPYPGEYKVPKGIVSKIVFQDGRKKLFNVAIVLDDLSPEDCLLYARDLRAPTFSLEEARSNPIPLNGKDWLRALGRYIDTSEIEQMISSGYFLIEKQKALASPVFGRMPLRCMARTSFRTLFENSFLLGSTFECPKCGGDIPSGRGITVCPHCGARKKETGAVCV